MRIFAGPQRFHLFIRQHRGDAAGQRLGDIGRRVLSCYDSEEGRNEIMQESWFSGTKNQKQSEVPHAHVNLYCFPSFAC